MSGEAFRDVNTYSEHENKTENSKESSIKHFENPTENMVNTYLEPEKKNENSKECSVKHFENANEKFDGAQRKNTFPLVEAPANGNGLGNTGSEAGIAEVEYIESENLNDVEDMDVALKNLLPGLNSKDWVLVCEALNDVRRLSIFRKDAMLDKLENVVSFIVKSMKNPRSAVCKTAIMTSSDIFHAYSDQIVESLDPLLVQLLLKASQDKRFVCEAAEKALIAMTTWVSPDLLLPKLQVYLKNRNPRIRAKASMFFSRSVLQLSIDGIKGYGIDKLIQIAASQLSDQLPESREAARSLLLELQKVFIQLNVSPSEAPDPDPEQTELVSWEHFCQSKLSPFSAQAVLRVTNIAREGLALGL